MMFHRTLLTVLLVLLAAGVAAAQPMGGTYTIKTSGGDYSSFATACAALSSRGYTRSCTMLCYDGTYTAFGNAMNWSSDSVWVVFKAAPGQRVVQTYAGYGLNCSGTNKLVFDGIYFQTGNACLYWGSATPNSRYGVVRNCSLGNYYTNGGYGLYMYNCDRFEVRNNYINAGYYGIYHYYDSDSNLIYGNTIYCRGYYGVYNYGSTPYNDGLKFWNNVVTGYTGYGMYNYYNRYPSLKNNSYYGGSSSYYVMYNYYAYNCTLYNNIFRTLSASYYPLYFGNTPAIDRCNYNCIYSPYTYVAYYGGARNWTAWRGLGFDVNGINADPQYVSPPLNLRIPSTSPCVNAGTYLAEVPDDFELDARSAPWDIGADEYIPGGDVAPSAFLAPLDTVSWGSTVTPRARIQNYSAYTRTFPVTFSFGGLYTSMKTVTNLPAYDSVDVTFDPWVATGGGPVTDSCYSRYWNDTDRSNDTITGSFVVRLIDAGVSAILEPVSGTSVDWGTTVTPTATVWNYGTSQQTFDVDFRIGTSYLGTETVTIDPMTSQDVYFDDWLIDTVGTVVMSCSTKLTGDQISDNDSIMGSVFYRLIDAQPTEIVSPVGVVDSGANVPVTAKWRNNGSQAASFYGFVNIPGSNYLGSQYLFINVPSLGEAEHTFTAWVPSARGTFSVRCSTRLTADMVPGNDVLTGPVGVQVKDVSLDAVIKPTATVIVDSTLYPIVTVTNHGTLTESFYVRFTIDDGADAIVWQESLLISSLAPGASVTDTFEVGWLAAVMGDYSYEARAVLVNDRNAANDVIVGEFAVAPPYQRGWVEMRSMPMLPSAKPVKDGGWLAKNHGTALMYAAKGNKSGDFFAYDPMAESGGTWTTLPQFPAGVEAKMASKGSNGTSDNDRYVYATKGNNTVGFWRYVVDSGWVQLANVPIGPDGKKIKGGTDMVYVLEGDTGFVYLLKGYKQSFFRYNTVSGVWDSSLSPAPLGMRPKWDKGSWLVYDGENKIWAHKAKYQELYAYDIGTKTWGPMLAGMPLVGMLGKTKKSKDGAGAAWFDGAIYALKGGNTTEYWKCTIGDTGVVWTELDSMPSYGSTLKKKRVKGGGNFEGWGDGSFYALKGNKTCEFWRWFGGVMPLAPRPERSGVMAGVGRSATALQLGPNPLTGGRATLSYSLPQAGPVRVMVFDMAGRNVATTSFVAGRTGSTGLDLRSLSAGVYLVKVEATGYKTARKLVVQ